ncbi:hypothetical protein EV681_4540 [Advenella incenata]|uniref:Uncharacterized protein n=1 Tax=Advenella incenata TaxID=267800 RepID=A0A4Q7V6L6_9BURK|nr:hypothetical protein [Advenella incenata]RZT91187.1 hypothetical protein EV681_4540 [Advenella incenata]
MFFSLSQVEIVSAGMFNNHEELKISDDLLESVADLQFTMMINETESVPKEVIDPGLLVWFDHFLETNMTSTTQMTAAG